ncbi:Annexin-B12 [Lamellibrachia satsuma]|nr:Annexin-B12 [Lamellibrachia satsuma]
MENEVPAAAVYIPPPPQGTIKPHPACTKEHLEDVAKQMKKAFKGLGTDEYRIIKLLTTHNNAQRQDIKLYYATAFGSDLVDDLKSEIAGNFEDLAVALLVPADEYDARCLHNAIATLGTNEDWLIEILCARTKEEILTINAAYKQLYNHDLTEDVSNETNGILQRILLSVVTGARDQTNADDVDVELVQKDARELYDAGEGKNAGTDDDVFNLVFALRSWSHLKAVFGHYKTLADKDIEQSIANEFSFNAKKAFLAIAKYAKDPSRYFAECLRKALKESLMEDMADFNSDADDSLIRLMVSHSETDLMNVKTRYREMYGERLEDSITDECAGDYRKLLLKILTPGSA